MFLLFCFAEVRADETCSDVEENQKISYAMSIIAIICIIVYIISFAVGIGPIPHYLTSEIFQQVFKPFRFRTKLLNIFLLGKNIKSLFYSGLHLQASRTTACAIAQGVNWTCNLILSLTFIYLQSKGLGFLDSGNYCMKSLMKTRLYTQQHQLCTGGHGQ